MGTFAFFSAGAGAGPGAGDDGGFIAGVGGPPMGAMGAPKPPIMPGFRPGGKPPGGAIIGGMPIPGGMPMPGMPMGPAVPSMPGGMPIAGMPMGPIAVGMPIIGGIDGTEFPCEYLHRSPLLHKPREKSPHISLPFAAKAGAPKTAGATAGAAPAGGPWMAGLKSWENLQKSPRTHSPRM